MRKTIIFECLNCFAHHYPEDGHKVGDPCSMCGCETVGIIEEVN